MLLDDLLTPRAAAIPVRCAPTRKRWQSAVRAKNRSTSHRHYQGVRTAPQYRALELTWDLAVGDGTTPWPLIAEQIATAIQASIHDTDTDTLRKRLVELIDREHDLEAEENRQTAKGTDHEAAAAADIAEAEVQLERAAIRRELIRREAKS